MPVLTGVLLDVSGSMERSVGDRVEERGGSWARSIFKVVDDLIKQDVSNSNHVFALGVGASGHPAVFDMLSTLHKVKASSSSNHSGHSTQDVLEEVLRILECSGAPRVRHWADMEVLLSSVSRYEAVTILPMLQRDSDFKRAFVEYLPDECKKTDLKEYLYTGIKSVNRNPLVCGFLKSAGPVGELAKAGLSKPMKATEDSIREVVRKGMALASKRFMVRAGETAVMKAHAAYEILHGCLGDGELTGKRVDELMEAVKPFIFGCTPLIKAVNQARDLFALPQYQGHHKLLFVLSDGQPTDGKNPPISALSALGVTTVSCFITDRSISDPFRLYSTENCGWEEPAKFMFRLSSAVATQLIPRTIFVKRGWKIDITETRLFCQVNHPDIISDVCDLARNVVCCQEALSDILTTVSLDIYINQANQGFGAKEQEGGTCYANASAAVLHLAMQRIVGREGGYPDFFSIRKELIEKYGKEGANTVEVLEELCPQYRLHSREVDARGAMMAVAAKRPVIARFRLTEDEWKSFSGFYKKHPRGILTKSEIDISQRPHNAKLSGHAVVLSSYNNEGLRLMNSWGDSWADGGFFRVQNAGVLGLEFVDVFWTLNDLTVEERAAYARHGPGIAKNLMSSLQGLHTAQYKCPLCFVQSRVMEFSGHLLQAKCPQCKRTFSTKDAGDDLVLNLYLTSLYH